MASQSIAERLLPCTRKLPTLDAHLFRILQEVQSLVRRQRLQSGGESFPRARQGPRLGIRPRVVEHRAQGQEYLSGGERSPQLLQEP